MEEIELIEKRDFRVKHFLQDDGTVVAKVYDGDIHFLRDGNFEEIDNRFEKKGNVYVNKNNDFKVEFEETLNDYLMKMTKDDYYLNIKLSDCNHPHILIENSDSKVEQTVLYDEVMNDICIEYKTLSNKVKETVVLKSSKYSKVNFVVETNTSLLLEDNGIIASDGENKVFEIEAPYMVDSVGNINNNVYYCLKSHGNHYDIELNLDVDWLKSDEVVYPVYIDPTINSKDKNLNFYDTYIYPGDTDYKRFELGYLKAGVEKVGSQERINRTLIKFDLPVIGTADEIIDANLYLVPYAKEGNTQNNYLVELHRLTSDWTESGANWDNMHDKFDSRVEYMTPSHRSTINNNVLEAYPVIFSITGLVKKWYEDTPNYGVMIKSCDEKFVDNNYPIYFSKNSTVDGNPKPIFMIHYRNKNGLEDYWDYRCQEFTNGNTYVNTHTGNLTSVFNVGNIVGGVMPASLNLIYNTNDVVLSNETFFGKGFKLNLEQFIEKVEDSYKYIDGDGTVHYFVKKNENNSEVYCDEDGMNFTLYYLNDTLKMVDKDNNEMLFMLRGKKYFLTRLKDSNNNYISIELNGNNSINKIKDNFNKEISINYLTNNIVINSADSVVELQFDNGLLKCIESINGTTIFTYNENKVISSITDVNGLKINYEYYNKKPYKIKKVSEYSISGVIGNYYIYKYSIYETTITHKNGLVESLAYNEYGNVVSRNIMSGIDVINDAYSVESTFDDRNKLVSSMNPTRYIKNHLRNTSFEDNQILFVSEIDIITSFDTENAFLGGSCLKIVSSAIDKSIEQLIEIEKGEYYTFSAYLKNDINCEMALSYINHDGEEIISKERVYSSDKYERYDVSINYVEDAISDLCIKITLLDIGTVYLDGIQLEKGLVANQYNIIENSDFAQGFNDWDCSAFINDTEVDFNKYIKVVDVNSNTKALKINMQYNLSTSIYKKFNIKGKTNDTFTLSFWYKNESTLAYEPFVGSNVRIFYEPYNSDNGHCILSYSLPITNGDTWQHFVYTEKAIEDFKSISIEIFTYSSGNSFQITGLSFYKNVSFGTFEYDDNGNLLSVSDQLDNVCSLKYDNNNQLIKLINTKGNDLIYEYDKSNGNKLINAVSPTGLSNRIKYDLKGNPEVIKVSKRGFKDIDEGLYKIRSYGTNKYLKAELNSVLLEENECSNTIWRFIKNEDGFKILYSTNEAFYLAIYNSKLILDRSDINNLFYFEKNEDGSYYIKVNEKKSDGGINVKYLTAKGLTVETIPFDNSDDIKFCIELVDDYFYEDSATYTEDKRFLKSITNSYMSEESYNYDSTTGLLQSNTNSNNIETSYSYNDKNQLIKIKQNDSLINYEYNNNLMSNINQGTKNYKIDYDQYLNVQSIKINDSVLATNEYDENSNLLKTIYGNNQTVDLVYDVFNRLSTMKKMDSIYNYYYDNSSNYSKIISDLEYRKLYYDENDRLCLFKNNDFIVKYEYDSENNIINMLCRLNNFVHTKHKILDSNERLIRLELDDVNVEYSYDSLDRMTSTKIGNLINYKYKYLSNGKRTTELVDKLFVNNNEYGFKYDKLANITDVYFNNNLVKRYFYNDYNELVEEYDYELNYKYVYSYDVSGNILKKTIKNIISNDIIREYQYCYTNGGWEDQLTSFDGNDINYDEIGNMLSYGVQSFTWINGTELESWKNNISGAIANFKYNDKGIRILKKFNGVTTRYHLLNSDILYEEKDGKLIYYLYDGSGVIGFEYEGSKYFYLKNWQDDVIAIMDSQGDIIVNYRYDSWGKIISISDGNNQEISQDDFTHLANINPFRYRSYYYDVETKLYYLNHRYYNPDMGRFISLDKVLVADGESNSYNIYRYCGNNPINMVDEEGSFAIPLAKGAAAFGALILTAVYCATKILVETAARVIANQQKGTNNRKNKSNDNNDNANKCSVYILSSRSSGVAMYVGRTEDLKKTEYRHKNNPFRTDLKFNTVKTNMSYAECRVWEQYLIQKCRTLVKDTNNPVQNQINGMSEKKKAKYQFYWDQIYLMQEENLVPCTGYNER